MEQKFLVITQTGAQKEIYQWWERATNLSFDTQVFDTFEEARSYMRRKISEVPEAARNALIDDLFGEYCDDGEYDGVDWDSEEYAELESVFNELHGKTGKVESIRDLTVALLADPDYMPEKIDEVHDTDDADHYLAFVCNEKAVIADYYGTRLEYNIHNMDLADRYYYFEWVKYDDEHAEHPLSVRLLPTGETADDSGSVFPDEVSCRQISFGSYVQGVGEDAEKEPILWDVLEEKEDKLFVLSHKCLEYRPFNDGMKSAKWENSEIRKWLNGEFFETAFSDDEKDRILTSTIKNRRRKATEDRVFLLSEEEFSLLGRDNRSARLTSLTRAQYSEVIGYRYSEPYGFWWLRSPGRDVKGGYDLVHVCANGTLNGFARSDSSHPNGIRPAMWIKK